MRKSRWLIVTGIVLAVFAIIAYGFLPRPIAVDVAKVSRGQLTITVEEEGETRVKDRFVISAPVSGYMRRITLEPGDLIKRGQTIAELEPLRSTVLDPRSRAAAEAEVSSAEANLKASEENARARAADAEYAEDSIQRMKKLYEVGYVSKDAMEQAQSEAKQSRANLLSAEAAVRAARSALDKARTALLFSAEGAGGSKSIAVRSPVEGRVLKLQRQSEGVVNAGDPLVDVGNPENLEVKVEVLSSDAVKIKPGTPVVFERWGGDTALTGKVTVVEPGGFTKVSSLGVEEQRTLVIADITSLPVEWQRLGDNYRVDASFIIWAGKDVLQIPAGALFRKDGEWAVFAYRNKRAELRRVEIGHRNGFTAEVVSGLGEGEMVITHPDESVKDGSRVKPR
jgi:HlyD family secretion protein